MAVWTQAQVDDKLTGVIGGIHNHNNVTSQSIPTGLGYTKLANFSGDNNGSQNVTNDFANGTITILKSGVYRIEGAFSFSGVNNVLALISPFVDNTEVDEIHLSRKLGLSGDIGNSNFTGTYRLVAGEVLDVRARHDDGGAVSFTFHYMNFNISREDI